MDTVMKCQHSKNVLTVFHNHKAPDQINFLHYALTNEGNGHLKLHDRTCHTEEFKKNPFLMEKAVHLLVPEGFPIIQVS
jgi:hypothetical protein